MIKKKNCCSIFQSLQFYLFSNTSLSKLKELEEEWEKVDSAPPIPTRFTRSQQKKMAEAPPPAADTGGSEDGPGILFKST